MSKTELNGLLLVDKPADVTSHDVVGTVRKSLGQKSVGHTGTLDPIATGLMILVLGEATKLSDYIITADKAYTVTIRLGVTTDSLDRTGAILSETECRLSAEEIRVAAESLQGEFEWPVPLFSAAKIDGKKLYEYARSGEDVVIPMKTMKFWGVEVLEVSAQGLKVTLQCSKGSFIRSWADQLGKRLGVGGIVQELRRVRVGSWSVDRALSLDGVRTPGDALIPMAQSLPDWKAVIATEKDARLMGNGQIPKELANRLVVTQKDAFERQEPIFVKVLSGAGDLLAILNAEAGQGLKIRRVFRSNP